ncbi:hypothetical protein CHS0354_032636 [Potamilus streckersoni]|uniref:Uncharacterized protein n=1 Tax=Potamilus streckersoni TaxID=2493646 RepID=A0AAE0SF58_9BIVA|nr:hypothetical protein CHS0354_032636 [Potamilus streckersoni]
MEYNSDNKHIINLVSLAFDNTTAEPGDSINLQVTTDPVPPSVGAGPYGRGDFDSICSLVMGDSTDDIFQVPFLSFN